MARDRWTDPRCGRQKGIHGRKSWRMVTGGARLRYPATCKVGSCGESGNEKLDPISLAGRSRDHERAAIPGQYRRPPDAGERTAADGPVARWPTESVETRSLSARTTRSGRRASSCGPCTFAGTGTGCSRDPTLSSIAYAPPVRCRPRGGRALGRGAGPLDRIAAPPFLDALGVAVP
jgi:hypothetical protein